MSMFVRVLGFAKTSLQFTIIKRDAPVRFITSSRTCFQEGKAEEEGDTTEENKVPPSKDRRQIIPVETSIRYMSSDAYKQTYGDHPVWKLYRRNHKGQIPPKKTRKTCVRGGIISTGNPCPICRDEYLVLDHRNTELLKQFIFPKTGEILSYQKTGICQRRYKQLLVAVHKATASGTLPLEVPLREYDYSDWYSEEKQA